MELSVEKKKNKVKEIYHKMYIFCANRKKLFNSYFEQN